MINDDGRKGHFFYSYCLPNYQHKIDIFTQLFLIAINNSLILYL